MGDYYSVAVVRLFDMMVSAYLFVVLLRILLDAHRASYYNPICQLSIRLTNFAIKPLRRVTPQLRRIDSAAVLFWVLLTVAYSAFFPRLYLGVWPTWPGLLALSVVNILQSLQNFYFWAIMLQALLSWIPSMQRSQVMDILLMVTEPILRPARRLLPPMSGLDLSPVFVLFILYAISTLVILPLLKYANILAFMT